jgi:plastocyanin
MCRSKLLWTLAVSVLGVTLAGCGKSQHMTMEVEAGGKVFVKPKIGDVVNWVGTDGKPSVVSFTIPGLSPCQESGNVSTCTVVKAGVFPYSCTGCTDPAVVVGSDSGPFMGTKYSPRNVAVRSDAAYLYCDASSHAPKASPDPLPASVSDTIQWFPTDPKMANWTVTLQAGTCKEGTINQSQPVCTVQAGAASQTYSITADTCTGTGSAGLTIQ